MEKLLNDLSQPKAIVELDTFGAPLLRTVTSVKYSQGIDRLCCPFWNYILYLKILSHSIRKLFRISEFSKVKEQFPG